MAIYGVKYRIQYYRNLLQGTHYTKIDIEEKDYVGAITELKAQDNPLEIEFEGDVENIFQPVVSTGATIRVYASPFQLINLFTDDPQKYRVKIYKWGIAGDKLFWQGFITPNIYSESYANLNAPVAIHCNDGLKLLNDIPFKKSDGTLYGDTSTLGNTLDNILGKINLDFTKLIKSSDLIVYKPTVMNPFTNIKVINDNYVDESGEIVSCLGVLKAICGGLGLTMKLKGDTIYFVDPLSLRDPSNCRHYKISNYFPPISNRYDESRTDADGFTPNIGGILDISLNQVRWKSTDVNLDITPIANKLFVEYNPYNFTSTAYDFNDQNNLSNAGSFIFTTGTDASYWVNSTVTFKDWTITNGTQEAIKRSEFDEPVYYLKLMNNASGSYQYTFPNSYVFSDASVSLNISFDAYVNTIGNYAYDGGTAHDIWYMDTSISIKVGSRYYAGGQDEWGNPVVKYQWNPSEVFQRLRIIDKEQYRSYDSRINDIWIPVSITIPIYDSASVLEGKISIKILDKWSRIFPAYNGSYVRNISIKNPKVQIVKSNSLLPIENSPIRFIAEKESASVYAQGNTISTIHGTGPYGCSKGTFLYSNSTDIGVNDRNQIIKGFSFSKDVSVYDSNHMILRSFISQYSSPRFLRTGTLDVRNKLFDTDLFIIKESNRMGNKEFYIISGTYNDRRETMDVAMIELPTSRDSIT